MHTHAGGGWSHTSQVAIPNLPCIGKLKGTDSEQSEQVQELSRDLEWNLIKSYIIIVSNFPTLAITACVESKAKNVTI